MPHKIIAKQYTTKSMPARKRSLSYEWVAKWRILLIDMAIKLKEKKKYRPERSQISFPEDIWNRW